MAVGFGTAQPKPESQKRVKGRKDRTEAKLRKAVRAKCVERDGACRLGEWELNPDDWHADELEGDECEGPAQWCHMTTHRRSHTRGQSAERRHTTAASFMGCQKHHDQYDGRLGPRLFVKVMEESLGANGPLEFLR